MFEILRRNYLYRVSLLAFEPHSGSHANVNGAGPQPKWASIKSSRDHARFSEYLCLVLQQRQVDNIVDVDTRDMTREKAFKILKMTEETYELTCPMYCMCVHSWLNPSSFIHLRAIKAAQALISSTTAPPSTPSGQWIASSARDLLD